MTVRGRFAPSPTGDLHQGSLLAALGSWLSARGQGGQWLVRIDDIDPPREVAGASQRILASLQRLGLASDTPVVFQSQRRAAYDQAFAALREQNLVFPCWCSRQLLASQGGVHRDGRCLIGPQSDRAPAWRARTPDEVLHFHDRILGPQQVDLRQSVGDFVVRRVEGYDSYQLATVVDDAWQGVSEVVRGADLLSSTPRQWLLQRWLGLPHPDYAHLPVLLDAQGRKLSKSSQAPALDELSPEDALRTALRQLGSPAAAEVGLTPSELLAASLAIPLPPARSRLRDAAGS